MESFLDKQFIDFIHAYHNYNLHIENLLDTAIDIFISSKKYEYEQVENQYNNYNKILINNELHETSDLYEPINNIYSRIISLKYR